MFSYYDYFKEYDGQGRLIQSGSNITRYSFDPPIIIEEDIYHYEYWCKDLVKVNEERDENDNVLFRIESYYEGIDECFEIENELLEIDVFPNPTLGMITVNSPVFKSGNTQISVFDMNGKLLLQKNESMRMELVEFDLGNLPNGIYVIQLMNQEHFVQNKIVLAK